MYQAAADVLLMPYSRSIEASSGQDIAEVINPMKMFEYLASGRAIVSADLPVIREVLNEENAVFCEPGVPGGGRVESSESRDSYRDHDAQRELVIGNWKSTIEGLLADESRRVKFGNQAKQDVERYTWLKRAERILDGF